MPFDIEPSSGIGPSQIRIQPDSYNTTGSDITKDIQVEIGGISKTIRLIQKPSAVSWRYTFTIEPTSTSISSEGGSVELNLISTKQQLIEGIPFGEVVPAEYSVAHYSGNSFITVNGNVLTAEINNSSNDRTEVIRFTQFGSNESIDITVSQAPNFHYEFKLDGEVTPSIAEIIYYKNSFNLKDRVISRKVYGDGTIEEIDYTITAEATLNDEGKDVISRVDNNNKVIYFKSENLLYKYDSPYQRLPSGISVKVQLTQDGTNNIITKYCDLQTAYLIRQLGIENPQTGTSITLLDSAKLYQTDLDGLGKETWRIDLDDLALGLGNYGLNLSPEWVAAFRPTPSEPSPDWLRGISFEFYPAKSTHDINISTIYLKEVSLDLNVERVMARVGEIVNEELTTYMITSNQVSLVTGSESSSFSFSGTTYEVNDNLLTIDAYFPDLRYTHPGENVWRIKFKIGKLK